MKTSIHQKLTLLLITAVGALAVLDSQRLDAQNDPESRAFYEQLQHTRTVEQIEPFLDTEDPQNARLVIIRLVDLDRAAALPILRALWDGRDLPHTIKHMDTYQHSIARLTLAEQLMALSPMPEYGNYIKQAAGQDSWMVRSLAAEALAVLDDAESVDLLMQLARSENSLVAESAIAALSHLVRSGDHATEASQAIQELHRDPRIKQERVRNKITEAYEDASLPKSAVASIDHDLSLDEQVRPYLEKLQYQAAINIVLPEAENGNAHAQHLAGELYLARNPPDYDRAREWLQRAAKQGYAPAKTSLANLYLSGRGVERDEQEAVRLLQEAEQQGDRSAHRLLERARKQGWWGM
jgi:TPR repeat protein